MKKTIFLLIAMAAMAQFSNAQERNKFRVGLDLGYAIPDGGAGVLVALEAKYNVADNMNVGLRYESAALAKNVVTNGASVESSISASGSYIGTFDYYFSSGSSLLAPFVGAGAGYSTLASIDLGQAGVPGLDLDSTFGGLLRAGFEAGKFRVAAAYNLVSKSTVGNSEIKNSYIGLSLGFYVGGGKWKK